MRDLATMLAAAGAMLQAVPAESRIDAVYALAAPGGGTMVRAATDAGSCPSISIDGRRRDMALRATPATLPLRPTISPPEQSKPSAFPVRICERWVPGGTHRATVGNVRAPLVNTPIRRIVVIGDTGCRLKATEKAWQACNDPSAYPFAQIAARASRWHPDLVIHVGDYLYRETACPKDAAGCQGSPWGYGWDAWRADLFKPGAALFAAAPWLVVRGNHESCARAGQGWWRLLDPGSLVAGRDCINPAGDSAGDYSPPYSVPLSSDAQVVVMDLSIAGKKKIERDDPRFAEFSRTWTYLRNAGASGRYTFAAGHYPILGIAADEDGDGKIKGESKAVQSVFAAQNGPLVPPGIDVLLAGHIHMWEQIDFASDHPSQFITGFSGTQEDAGKLPAHLPEGAAVAPDAIVRHFASWQDGFGWMTLERRNARRWDATVYAASGQILNRCRISGRHSTCDHAHIG